MMERLSRFGAALCVLAVAACGSDSDPASPEDPAGLYPDLEASIVTDNCIRGTTQIPGTLNGTLDTGDCSTAGTIYNITDDGYYEIFRVRVGTPRSAIFQVTSGFDSFLDLGLVDLVNSNFQLVAFDDDSNGEDAQLTVNLQPNLEYWLVISGFGPEDVGTYTITVS